MESNILRRRNQLYIPQLTVFFRWHVIHLFTCLLYTSNEEALNKLIEKVIKKYDLNDKTQYNKMCRYLLGKGFSYGEIQEALFKYTNYDTEW